MYHTYVGLCRALQKSLITSWKANMLSGPQRGVSHIWTSHVTRPTLYMSHGACPTYDLRALFLYRVDLRVGFRVARDGVTLMDESWSTQKWVLSDRNALCSYIGRTSEPVVRYECAMFLYWADLRASCQIWMRYVPILGGPQSQLSDMNALCSYIGRTSEPVFV